uniref:Uncharacterized protein n=1 Tax=Ixodes ricinus TaxID=34613 RepID=A0A6B0UPH2_IXORI
MSSLKSVYDFFWYGEDTAYLILIPNFCCVRSDLELASRALSLEYFCFLPRRTNQRTCRGASRIKGPATSKLVFFGLHLFLVASTRRVPMWLPNTQFGFASVAPVGKHVESDLRVSPSAPRVH